MQNDVILPLFQRWMLASSRADGTIKLRMRHVRTLARTAQLTLVSHHEIETALARTRELSADTRHSMLASWRLFYRWAVAHKYVMLDPTTAVDGIPVPVRMPKVAPDSAISSAIERASPRDKALILAGRYGCLRLTEITTLHMRQRSGDVLFIRGKGDKDRIVYANDDFLAALLVLERSLPFGYYFPGDAGQHMHPQSVHKVIKRVTGWNPHSLRHAGATAAYRATGDLRAVQDMLGHASLSTTERYLHLEDTARRAAAAGTIIGRIAA